MRVYARGNNRTREGFCMKTSPVTPSFYCFNIMLSLRANVRKKTKKNSTEGNLHSVQIVVFPSLQEIGSVIFFFKLLCICLFRCQKLWFQKKTWGHRVNFLVISDISEKSGLENPFGMLPW